MSTDETEVEHGPAQACYSGGYGEPYYQPFIACLCGKWSLRDESWEDVGRAFDEHLDATRAPADGGKP